MAQKACPDCKCVVEEPQSGCPFCSNESSDLVAVDL